MMPYSNEDKKRVLSFYDGLIEEHGLYNYKALSWSSERSKDIRLEVLCGVGDMEGRSLVDVGCGFGDLYGFLQERYGRFTYTGIDINPAIIEAAQKKYPGVDFEVADFGEFAGEGYDYVFASGALSFKVPDYKKLYFGYIKKMFALSRVAAAFNMLDKKHHIDDDLFATYTVPEVYEFCSALSGKIIIRQDYLKRDFTFYLFH